MQHLVALVLTLTVAAAAHAAQPRISFVRTMPAPHDLGQAEEVAILYAMGDNDQLGALLEIFAERVNASNMLRLRDTTLGGRRITVVGERPDVATLDKLRRHEPADAYLGVKEFTCRTTEEDGEASTRDADRNRIRQRRVWIEATCTARVDVLAADLRRTVSFAIKGEGTSPRVAEITDEERASAIREAVRHAAINAAEQITPRRVRESILLDENAPAFAEAMVMLDASRPEEARAIWAAALKKHRNSAGLHYNLAAVCELLGDTAAAQKHYIEARRLQPKESRYRDELHAFLRRHGAAQK